MTGAVVLAVCGAPGELSSKIPMPHLDTETMPWIPRPVGMSSATRSYLKVLRGDEENLDTFYLARTVRGAHSDGTSSHEAPEEAYFVEGEALFHDSVMGGRLLARAGTYVHRGSFSVHGYIDMLSDHLTFKHDYFSHDDAPDSELFLSSYATETPAVKALREGRDPGLPRRW